MTTSSPKYARSSIYLINDYRGFSKPYSKFLTRIVENESNYILCSVCLFKQVDPYMGSVETLTPMPITPNILFPVKEHFVSTPATFLSLRKTSLIHLFLTSREGIICLIVWVTAEPAIIDKKGRHW